MPMFSIIVPVYNVLSYVEGSVGSLLAQDFSDWEAILVDDGSTDGSAEALEAYAKQDERIRVIHQPNAGVSAARNHGVDLAKGDYVVFLDADDKMLPWALRHLAEYVKQAEQVDIVMFRCQTVVSHGEPLPNEIAVDDLKLSFYDLGTVEGLRTGFHRVVGSLLAWNGCYRRALFQRVRFKPFPNGEDMLFGSEALCAASSVKTTNDVLYRYLRARPGSAVNAMTMRHVMSVIGVAEEWCHSMSRFNRKKEIADLWRRKFRAYCLGAVVPLVSRVEKERIVLARSELLKAVLRFSDEYPDVKKTFGNCRMTILAKFPLWCVFYLLEMFPFRLRVCVAKMRDRIL